MDRSHLYSVDTSNRRKTGSTQTYTISHNSPDATFRELKLPRNSRVHFKADSIVSAYALAGTCEIELHYTESAETAAAHAFTLHTGDLIRFYSYNDVFISTHLTGSVELHAFVRD